MRYWEDAKCLIPLRMPHVKFHLNGKETEAHYEAGMHLLEVLREECGITSCKNGCAPEGACGCCLVNIDGKPALSCLRKPEQMAGHDIRTVEGLERPDGSPHPLQVAFRRHHGLQCGFCTPGFLMTALPIYRAAASMSDEELREALGGQLCRCTGYVGIVEAVRAAAAIEREAGA